MTPEIKALMNLMLENGTVCIVREPSPPADRIVKLEIEHLHDNPHNLHLWLTAEEAAIIGAALTTSATNIQQRSL